MTHDDRWEPLERLASTAPTPAAGLADTVLARGRARRRRAMGAVLASAGTAIAVVIGAMVFAGSETSRSDAPPAASSTSTPTIRPTTPEPAASVSPRLKLVSAGAELLVADATERPVRRLLVYDQLCDEAELSRRDTGKCRPWSTRERSALIGLLSRIAPARFVPEQTIYPLPRGTLQLEVAALKAGAKRGQVFVFASVGFGQSYTGCLGETYHFARTRTGWRPADGGGVGVSVIC